MLNRNELKKLLERYGIGSVNDYTMIDSSHGESDLRHNYIIDKKYVLRVNSAKVMGEKRIKELNRLIGRYNAFGYKAPYFLPYDGDRYVLEYQNCFCYLSEYLDLEIADSVKEHYREELIKDRIVMVSGFAQAFKGVDLSETLSMYSLFDLCPYDQLSGLGIDEKQENFNTLYSDLVEAEEPGFAEELKNAYEKYRTELKAVYKRLPRCVFQGDENFSNLCVDGDNRVAGLFDFNMSGTEVIANYLANIALQGNYFYEEEFFGRFSAQDIFKMLVQAFKKNTELVRKYYTFDRTEYDAYLLYAKIAMISGYWNQCAFSEYLKTEQHKDKVVDMLRLIISCSL